MGKKQLPSLFVMLICQIIEKKTFPIASRDIQTGFFIFFCSFVIFSNGFYDDAKCNWRWDDYMESSKFFFLWGLAERDWIVWNLWLWEERRSRFLLFKIRKKRERNWKGQKKWRNFIEKSSIFVFNENCRKFFFLLPTLENLLIKTFSFSLQIFDIICRVNKNTRSLSGCQISK